MPDSSTDSGGSRLTSKVAKQYAFLVLVLGFGLVALCTATNRIKPGALGSTGQFGALVWLDGKGLGHSGDNQIITSDEFGMQVFDLPKKKVFDSRERLFPSAVSGHWLAYEDKPDEGPYQIKVRDLEMGKEIALGAVGLIQQSPDISGNTVVWVEFSTGKSAAGQGIYAYDLKSGTRLPIAVEGGKVRCCPQISSQWVIYLQGDVPWDSRQGSIELHAYSLATGEDFVVGSVPAPNNASFGTFHALDNDKVAWIRPEPDYKASVHLFDLTTREDHALTPPLSGYLGDISVTDKRQLVVFNNKGWEALDWSQPQPEVVELPLVIGTGYLKVVGGYLVGRNSGDLFVTQILP